MDLEIRWCKIIFSQGEEDQDTNIKLDYIFIHQLKENSQSTFSHRQNSGLFQLKALSDSASVKPCVMNFLIPKYFKFNTITIKCVDECIIVSNIDLLKLDQLLVKGDTIYSNFR